MKEVVVNINKVNLYSLPCIIIGTPLFIIVYKYFSWYRVKGDFG